MNTVERFIDWLWLTWATLIETFQLNPITRRARLMNIRHSTDMEDLHRAQAHEVEREESNFTYRLMKERSRAEWLARKVETIREFHGSRIPSRKEAEFADNR